MMKRELESASEGATGQCYACLNANDNSRWTVIFEAVTPTDWGIQTNYRPVYMWGAGGLYRKYRTGKEKKITFNTKISYEPILKKKPGVNDKKLQKPT